MTEHWRPSASPETLRARAELLRGIREFFHARDVLEVDTPVLSAAAAVDRHIGSFHVPHRGGGWWLHTSPEFPMKRMLAAGSGPIYQLCHVFRDDEPGRLHNPEFLMLEWYRPGWNHIQLMDEVEALLGALGIPGPRPLPRLTYRDAFRSVAAIDPFDAPVQELRSALETRGVGDPGATGEDASDRDFWLHLWMGTVIGPALGADGPCFVTDFPATQAALARVRPGNPPVAERFELFWRGMELANGFNELTDATEQEQRFRADQAWRRSRGLDVPPFDRNLVGALAAGMPECAGVAMGVDRLLMLLRGLERLSQAMPFDAGRA